MRCAVCVGGGEADWHQHIRLDSAAHSVRLFVRWIGVQCTVQCDTLRRHMRFERRANKDASTRLAEAEAEAKAKLRPEAEAEAEAEGRES